MALAFIVMAIYIIFLRGPLHTRLLNFLTLFLNESNDYDYHKQKHLHLHHTGNHTCPPLLKDMWSCLDHLLLNNILAASTEWGYWWSHFYFHPVNMSEKCKSQLLYHLLSLGKRMWWEVTVPHVVPSGKKKDRSDNDQGRWLLEITQNKILTCMFNTI